MFYVEEGDVAAGERFNEHISNSLSISGSTMVGGGWATKVIGKRISGFINYPSRMLSSKSGSFRLGFGSGSASRETIARSLVSEFNIRQSAADEIAELLSNSTYHTPSQFKEALLRLKDHLDQTEFDALVRVIDKTTTGSTGAVSNVAHLEDIINKGYRVRAEVEVGGKVADAVVYAKTPPTGSGTTSQNPLAVQEVEQFTINGQLG